MRLRLGSGVWEIFVPGLGEGHLYKYEIVGPGGELLPSQGRSLCGGVRAAAWHGLAHRRTVASRWSDNAWLEQRWRSNDRSAPIAIYEVHLGSWRRKPEEGDRFLTWRELAAELVPYVLEMGFTHLEVLPVGRVPLRRFVGLSTHWFVRTDQPVRHARRFPLFSSTPARGRHRAAASYCAQLSSPRMRMGSRASWHGGL